MTSQNTESVDAVSSRVARLKYVFAQLSQELQRLHEQAMSGSFGELKDQPKVLRELLLTSKDLMRAEVEIERILQARNNALCEGELDFEAARKELECKLDRLATALRKGGISG